MTLTYPVITASRLMVCSDFTPTVRIADGQHSAKMSMFVPNPDVQERVSSYATTQTEVSGGPPGPTDDIIQKVCNENAVEHLKFQGSVTWTPIPNSASLAEQGYRVWQGEVNLSSAGLNVWIPATVLSTVGTYREYYVILPYWETYVSEYSYTASFGCVPWGRPGMSGCLMYWTSPGVPARVNAKFFACWNSHNERLSRIYTKSQGVDPSTLTSRTEFDVEEMPWRGTYYDTFSPTFVLNNPPDNMSVPEYLAYVLHKVGDDYESLFKPDHPMIDVWGELANKATGSMKTTQSNVLSTAKETVTLLQGVQDLLEAAAALKTASPTKFLKAVGNLRLAWKWGIPLTAKDATTIADGIQDKVIENKLYTNPDRMHVGHAHKRVPMQPVDPSRTTGIHVSRDCWLKILYKDNNTAKAQKGAKLAADLNLITLENGWDVVPYSFVVDWMTDFASVLNAADNVMYRTAYWDIYGSVEGVKDNVHIDTAAFAAYDPAFSGSVDVIHYVRRVKETIPLPTLGYLNPSVGVTQWLDGATLISQLTGD